MQLLLHWVRHLWDLVLHTQSAYGASASPEEE